MEIQVSFQGRNVIALDNMNVNAKRILTCPTLKSCMTLLKLKMTGAVVVVVVWRERAEGLTLRRHSGIKASRH